MTTIESTIRKLYNDGNIELSSLLAEGYLEFHPRNNAVREMLIQCSIALKRYSKAIELIDALRQSRPTDGLLLDRCMNYRVDPALLAHIVESSPSPSLSLKLHPLPLVTCTITTCKRLELFLVTMSSFLTTCTDVRLISRFIAIDDNSSDEERQVMQARYPFFEFVWKTPEDKGHVKSMQMLTSMVDTPYMLHLEDDWQFFDGLAMITDAIEVLEDDPQIGQVLFNQNYAELPESIPAGGHEKYTTSARLRYFIHEHCVNDAERANFARRHLNKMHCNYWPHFSLRPSLIRTSIFKHLTFEQGISFEHAFGLKYVQQGYCSAFLQGTRCKHIGRLTSDKTSLTLNAYDLIRQPQFAPLATFEAYVINLRRRPDRFEKFQTKTATFDSLKIHRFEAVDGRQLVASPRLNALFEHNDYRMRRGIVGCALSHLKLWAQFYKHPKSRYYCIFEDDVHFHRHFEASLNRVLALASDHDIIFLGATPNPAAATATTTTTTEQGGVVTVSASYALKHYLGGTFGYLISLRGVQQMFDIVEKTTMTNAIDTMIQKAADSIKVAYVIPAICSSEYNSNDTDIQKDFDDGLTTTTTTATAAAGLKGFKIYDDNGVPDFDAF